MGEREEKNRERRAGKMAQSVNYLWCKHKDLISICNTPVKGGTYLGFVMPVFPHKVKVSGTL